jgi:hypothetical protein
MPHRSFSRGDEVRFVAYMNRAAAMGVYLSTQRVDTKASPGSSVHGPPQYEALIRYGGRIEKCGVDLVRHLDEPRYIRADLTDPDASPLPTVVLGRDGIASDGSEVIYGPFENDEDVRAALESLVSLEANAFEIIWP